MDMKALAKSKRAHSLHHSKKHHPHQASKAPSISSGDKKPTGKHTKEKASHAPGSKPLPSNWDRYDADLDLGSEETTLASSSQPTEFVMPKSKGADYAHLISDAKAQSQGNYSSDVSVLLDDVISDFTQDYGPMLAAKGQSILSWVEDDNFEFEGKASTSLEAPFLSLNLNALAEQLAKAKLSERLFLEPDVLPLELLDDKLQSCGEDKHDPQTCKAAVAIDSEVVSSPGYNQEVSKNVQQYYHAPPPSATTALIENVPVQTSEEGLKPVKQIKDEIFQTQATNRSNLPNSISKHSVPEKSPIFEAASAEAELDMLLSSFSETKVFESSSSIGIPSTTISASAETVKKRTSVMKTDDAIDNLLEETSDLAKIGGRQLLDEVKAIPDSDDISSTLHSSSKSKLLDDFDSWLDTI